MYKDPQLSARARRLREELAKFGTTLTHAQALEVAARLEGDATLHVAQARKNAGVRIADVAREQAQALMFESLGRFEGQLEQLLEQLKLLTVLDDEREVDQLFGSLFRSTNGPILATGFNSLRADDIPAEFDKLVSRLQKVLVAKAKAPEQQDPSPLYQGPMLDWAVACGEADEMPDDVRQARYTVELKRDGHQFYLDIVPPHDEPQELEGKPQMTLFVEVNQGLPCVHISNDRYGDQVLTVFATSDGLYLRPDAGDVWIRTGAPDAHRQPGLHKHYARETEPPFGTATAMNHAFIVTNRT